MVMTHRYKLTSVIKFDGFNFTMQSQGQFEHLNVERSMPDLPNVCMSSAYRKDQQNDHLKVRYSNLYHPLVLNGGKLGTSIMVHLIKICRFKNKSVMITKVDDFATWVYTFQELNQELR